MKKVFLLAILIMSANWANAQEELSTSNKFSIELSGGLQKASRPFAPGYYVNSPSFAQGSLGVRYMMNDRFGLKADVGYNAMESDDTSLEFSGNYTRVSLQGVINLGHILNFSDWTNSVGLLFHTGTGFSMLNVDDATLNDGKDNMMHVMAGITPQVKLSDRFAVNVDLSLIGNIGQSLSWDGNINPGTRGIDGSLYNYSLGLTYYIGENEQHVDWNATENVLKTKVEELEARLAEVEIEMLDTDKDGVADYLDREENTMSGVAVNTKGIAIDQNKNGIPDEIESSLDNRFVNEKDYVANGNDIVGSLGIEELINKGYVSVYFGFRDDKPEFYSLHAINYLVKYMEEHPSTKAELVGFADEIGDEGSNSNLSKRRAKRVYDILVASGINSNRLTYKGNGEDASVDKNSGAARQLVRRVTFKLK